VCILKIHKGRDKACDKEISHLEILEEVEKKKTPIFAVRKNGLLNCLNFP
jgi:hypothetical protein